MKKIIPFKKQISFNSNVHEITSISLEHNLTPIKNNLIKGDFIISGEYKMTETSMSTDSFEFYIPCDIELDERYKTEKAQINIDDFYYEIIDSKVLEVNIDVLLDKLEEELIPEEPLINDIPIKHEHLSQLKKDLEEEIKNVEIREDTREENIEELEKEIEVEKVMKEEVAKQEERCIEEEDYTKSIFSNFSNVEEEYRTYKVYIVREGDSLEQIITKYQINKEELEKYNDLKELAIGDKIIIPYAYENNQ